LKNRNLYLFIIATLLAAGWFGFRWWQSYSGTVWKYLPENSFFVLQSTRLQDSTFRVQRGGLELKEVPLLNLASQQINFVRLLAKDSSQTERFFKNRQITYALQRTSGGRFTYLIYIPLNAFEANSWLESPSSTKSRVSTHEHEGRKVFDVSNLRSETLFSYTVFNNLMVMCTSGDVLEDWIRFAQSPLNATNSSRFETVQHKGCDLSVFIDSAILSDALKNDASTKTDAGLLYFLSLLPATESFHLDKLFSAKNPTLTSEGKKVKLSGYIDVLNNQPATPFRSLYYLPTNAAAIYRLGFKNSDAFVKSIRQRLEEVSSDSINDARRSFISELGNSKIDTFYRNIDKELILCQLEPNNVLTKGQIFLQQVKPNTDLEPFYKRLAILFNKNKESPYETFQGIKVYTIDTDELPAVLFGGLFKGFPTSYVAFYKNFIVYANDRQVLKDYLVDLEYERTWANSQMYSGFVNQAIKSSNFLLLVNTRKAKQYIGSSFLSYIFSNLNYDVTEKLPFDQLVFQTAYKNARAYSSLTFARTSRITNAKILNKLFLQQERDCAKPANGLYTVRNYPNALDKILVVNAANELQNPLAEQKKQKVVGLDGSLIDDIHSVDFLGVGRLQYVFATDKSLYVIDEDDTHRYTSLPLVQLPDKHQIRSLQRLESGIEGSYRFLVIDTQGYIYLWNSPSQQPQMLNKSRPFVDLLLPISEVEFEGKRHFLFTQAKGKIGMIKENGVIPAPYKLDLKTNIAGPFFGVLEPESGTTELVGMSKYGDLFRIALDGKIKSKNQLFRSDPTAFFRPRADATNRDWILFRESETQFAILDKKGAELFVGQDLVPDQKNIQYHFLGADIQFISIKSGPFTTLYNLKGEQIGDKPIPSEVPIKVSLVDSYNKLLIYTYSNEKLQTWSLKIR
jgi:hypothetical protein